MRMLVRVAMSCQRKMSSPLACAITTGRVLAFVEVKTNAKVNSFHACTKTNVAAVTSPGATNGRIICRIDWNTVQPSTSETSYSSLGIESKNVLSNHILKGIFNVETIRTRINFVSNNLNEVTRRNIGMSALIGGSNRVASMINNRLPRNLNLYREKANAAMVATSKVNVVVPSATIKLLITN